MMNKGFSLIVASMLCSTSMVAPVQAGSGEFIAGAIVGGAVGLLTNGANKAKAKKRTYRKSTTPSVSAEQRQNNRDLQERLNALGYDAGTPDGILGRRSKSAIAAFQRDHSMAPTGQLSNAELAVLYQMTSNTGGGVGAFAFAPAGGAAFPNASAPAFPAISNGTVAPAQGFPAMNGSDVSSSNFPAIGGGNSAAAPQFGTGASQFESAAPNFGTPGAAMGSRLGEATGAMGATSAVLTMPAVSSSSGDIADASAQAVSTANTDLSFASGKPSVLDIELGQSFEQALAALQQNGYEGCEGKDEFISCTAKKDGSTEVITIARGLQGQSVPVYFIDRTTELMIDVDKSVIEAKIAEAYPEIAEAPGQVVSNSAECAAHMARLNNIDAFESALEQLRKQPKPFNEWLEQSLTVCHEFYKVNVLHDGAQFRVRVVMFDGSYLENEILRHSEQNIQKVNNALKF